MNTKEDLNPFHALSSAPLSTGPSATTLGPKAPYPRPSYFLYRADGTCTALIEVDQLPESIRIVGVPASLSLAETAGMFSMGTKERDERRYLVETVDSATRYRPGELPSQFNSSNDVKDRRGGVQIDGAHVSRISIKFFLVDILILSKTEAIINDRQLATIVPDLLLVRNAAPPATARPVLEAHRSGTMGQKVYCTHWLRRGECDYVQQGCKYKHEMPDLATLRLATGIRCFPKWWREAMGMVDSAIRLPRPVDQIQNSHSTPVRPIALLIRNSAPSPHICLEQRPLRDRLNNDIAGPSRAYFWRNYALQYAKQPEKASGEHWQGTSIWRQALSCLGQSLW